jgi:archaeosine synthase beta-subunit
VAGLFKPPFSQVTPIHLNGRGTNRLNIVLPPLASCEKGRTSGPCTMCGFANHLNGAVFSEKDILERFGYVMEHTDLRGISQVDLNTCGSFFSDNELTPFLRTAVLNRLAYAGGVLEVSTETRAEYLTIEKIIQSLYVLRGKMLEIGIGLESVDDRIRNGVLKKNLDLGVFEGFARMLERGGGKLKVYVLFKPQTLTEREAIEDAVRTIEYAFRVGRQIGVPTRIALEPVFISKGTHLESIFKSGKYAPPNLWSILEILSRVAGVGIVHVGLSDEGLSTKDRRIGSCANCASALGDAIEFFNRTQCISHFSSLDCACRPVYLDNLEAGRI